MTNLPSDIIDKAENLIFRFELKDFDFKNIDHGQPFTLNYEKKRYRQSELCGLLFSSLPYFALTEEEFNDFKSRMLSPDHYAKESLKRIVRPGKKAGDYGEIILFLILEIFYRSKKLVTKVFYKTSSNLPVFGADAAHFTKEDNGEITFWFGESKFFKKFDQALKAAFDSVDKFLKLKLKDEIQFLTPSRIEINKGVDGDLHTEVVRIIESGISLDKLNIKVPVLITYELKTLVNFDDNENESFIDSLNKEFLKCYEKIQAKNWQRYYKRVTFVFFLLPVQNMGELKDLICKKDEGSRV